MLVYLVSALITLGFRVRSFLTIPRDLRFPQALPAWFIEKHGDKIRKSVILRISVSSAKAWNVNLTLYYCRNPPQVKFAGGWRAFVRFNDLSETDSLIFHLKAISEFEVYVFRTTAAGNPKQLSFQAPRKRSNDAELERKRAKRSQECRDELLAEPDGNFEGLAKKTIGDDHSVSDSSHSQTTSCSSSSSRIDLHLLESVGKFNSSISFVSKMFRELLLSNKHRHSIE